MIFILDTSAEKMDVKVGLKFGCLQILDDGTEYLEMMGMRISDIKEEKMEFLQAVKEGNMFGEIGLDGMAERQLLHRHIYISRLILKCLEIQWHFLILIKRLKSCRRTQE